MHKDFVPNEQHFEDLYLKDKIEKTKDWEIENNKFKDGTRKHETVSSFVEVKESSERLLIHYQIEKRNKEEEYAYITQCYIYKYSAKKYKF